MMRNFGNKAATTLLALALSVMMVPATAFAENGKGSYKVEADANVMKAGDRAYVYYADQLLGTFTVK